MLSFTPNTPAVARPVEIFRASCDNCSKSKVRCSKEQPRCQRCVHQGAACVYSPSQRLRRNRLPCPANQTPKTRGSSSNVASSLVDDASNKTITSFYQTPAISTAYPDLDRILNDGPSVPLGAEPYELHWLSDMPTAKELDMPSISSMSDDEAAMIGTPTVFETMDTAPETKWNSASSAQCSALALSTLQALDLPSTSCPGAYAAADQGRESPAADSHSLGTVLKASRLALKNALLLVTCPCNPNANVALLVTSVVFRMLCWYEAILKGSSSRGSIADGGPKLSNGQMVNQSCAERTSADLASSLPPAGSVIVPAITIGAYELDVEDRDRMITHIVLSELAKVNRVLDNFSKKFCRIGSMSLVEDAKSQVHFALEVFLRNKHHSAVLAAKEILDIK